MPQVTSDTHLAEELKAFANQCGSLSAAAAALKLDRTLVWRFAQNGRAIARNKTRLRKALREKNETNSTHSATNSNSSVVMPLPDPTEVDRLRKLFTTMIALLDAYDDRRQVLVDAAAPRSHDCVTPNPTNHGA